MSIECGKLLVVYVKYCFRPYFEQGRVVHINFVKKLINGSDDLLSADFFANLQNCPYWVTANPHWFTKLHRPNPQKQTYMMQYL